MTSPVYPTNWKLTKLFASDDDWQIAKQQIEVESHAQAFVDKWSKREDYLQDPAILKQALDEYEAWIHDYGSDGAYGYYFSLRSALEQSNPQIKAKENLILDSATKIVNSIQFFELRVGKIDAKLQEAFLSHKSLEPYRHFLQNLFDTAKYQLSEAEEKVVNLYLPMAKSNWVRMTSEFLSKEEREVKQTDGKSKSANFAEITGLLSDPNQDVRDSAAAAFNDILAKHVDTAEAELNSVLQAKKVGDELRGYARPDQSRHLHDDISSQTVDNLLQAVSNKFNISKRYYKLKAKLLKKPVLEYHERNVEVGSVNTKYSFEQAIAYVQTAFRKLDPEFETIFASFLGGGQIDAFPAKGKTDGAFCAHNLVSQPTYILLNFNGRTSDVLTLAHEVGHGINNELMRSKQNALNFASPVSTAEVASTFMEDFALSEIADHASDYVRLNLIMNKLNDDVSTIFRQVACYLFEQELHQGFRKTGFLSKEAIGELFKKHMSAYLGESVNMSTGSENWWVYWSHIRNYFYVYSYASGLLISKSLQSAVRKDAAFISKVKDFLSAGTSDSPEHIFQNLGIDITAAQFWETGIEEIEHLITQAEELATKLKY